MISCKDMTRLITKSMDASLNVVKRIGLRLHLLKYRFCLRYKRQLLRIREALHDLEPREVDTEGGPSSPYRTKRERIQDIPSNPLAVPMRGAPG